MRVKVDGGAGGRKRLVASAAVVDSQVLEYADGGGLVEGDVANGRSGGHIFRSEDGGGKGFRGRHNSSLGLNVRGSASGPQRL